MSDTIKSKPMLVALVHFQVYLRTRESRLYNQGLGELSIQTKDQEIHSSKQQHKSLQLSRSIKRTTSPSVHHSPPSSLPLPSTIHSQSYAFPRTYKSPGTGYLAAQACTSASKALTSSDCSTISLKLAINSFAAVPFSWAFNLMAMSTAL